MSRAGAPSVGRRRFVRWLGLGGLAAALGSAFGGLGARDVGAQAAKPAMPDSSATPAMPATPATPPPPSDEAKALHGILLGRYGAHIAEADKALLLPALEQSVQSGKALRARALANSVEPDVVFRAEAPPGGSATETRR